MINLPPGSAWLLGWDVYLSLARAWLDQRRPARAKLILAPLIDAPRGATTGLPLWWRLCRLQRWPRWASRQHHMPSQKPSPSHPAAACRAWSAVRGPCSRRCNSDCWDGDT